MKTLIIAVIAFGMCCQQVVHARPGGGGARSGGGSRPSAPSRPAPSAKPAPSRPAPSAKPAPSRPAPSAKPATPSRPTPSGDVRKNLPSKPSGNLSEATGGKISAGGMSGKASAAAANRSGSRPTQGQVQDFLKASGGSGAAATAANVPRASGAEHDRGGLRA